MDLAGRPAVVTGAGSGIGRALTMEAATRGMVLVLADASAKGLEETANLARALGVSVRAAVLDVRDIGALRALAEAAEVPAALVFANAGVLGTRRLLDHDAEDIQRIMDVNVMGVIKTVQAFAPAMMRSAAPSRVVITGSQASFTPFPELGAYSASKHALLAVAQTLASELEETSTRVCLLAPGSVATDIYQGETFPNAALGISPEAAARIAFDGALRGDFLISTHAGLADQLERRALALKTMLPS